jgi:hypothetical protein
MKRAFKLGVSFFIFISLLRPCLSQTEESGVRTSPAGKFNSLQKSLLIPGWGQIAEKRYLEGALFLSAEIFCFYKVFSYNHKGNYYYNHYKKADNVSDAVKYRGLTENYDIKRNKFLLAAAGVWIINLIDAYSIVRNKEKKRKSVNLKLDYNEKKDMLFTVSFSF